MNKNTLIIALLVGIIVTIGFGFYKKATKNIVVRTDLQIVQQTPTEDFYSMFKGSEYIAKAIGEMINSEEFMNKITKKDKKLENILSNKPLEQKLQKWSEIVKIDDVTVHGRFSVYVRSKNLDFAKTLSLEVADTIINNNSMYQGEATKKRKIVIVKNQDGETIDQYEEDDGNYGSHITIRVISSPFVVSENKSLPFVVGLVAFVSVIFLAYLRRVAKSL